MRAVAPLHVHRRRISRDDDGAFVLRAHHAGRVDECFAEEQRRARGRDELVDETAVFVGASDELFGGRVDLVTTRDDDRAAVVGSEVIERGERLGEVAVHEPVAKVRAEGNVGAGVEAECGRGVHRLFGVAGIDVRIDLGDAGLAADEFLDHAHESRVACVMRERGVDVGERHVGSMEFAAENASAVHVGVRRGGRLACVITQPVQRCFDARALVGREHAGHDDVAVDFEVKPLLGRERGEGAIKFGVWHALSSLRLIHSIWHDRSATGTNPSP